MVFGKLAPLAEADTALLLQAFATRLKGAGVGVAWRDFVAAVDNTESPAKGLQLPTLPPADEQVVAETCGRLAHLVRTRRLLLRPFFQDMEKSRRAINRVDHISRMQFAECLSSLGLDITAAELQVLARKFDDKGDGGVNYVAFQVRNSPRPVGGDAHGPARHGGGTGGSLGRATSLPPVLRCAVERGASIEHSSPGSAPHMGDGWAAVAARECLAPYTGLVWGYLDRSRH
eukprot:scaffold10996_cov90-Isochrysis_galbana.AAC.7